MFVHHEGGAQSAMAHLLQGIVYVFVGVDLEKCALAKIGHDGNGGVGKFDLPRIVFRPGCAGVFGQCFQMQNVVCL